MSCSQFVATTSSLAIGTTLVTPLYLSIIAVLSAAKISLEGVPVYLTLAAWMIAIFFVALQVASRIASAFSIRLRSGFLLKRLMFPDSLSRLFLEMRITLGVFALCQLLTAAVAFFGMHRTSMQLIGSPHWNPILFASILMILIGTFISLIGDRLFLQTRGRKIRRWVAGCWRGVMLTSFIPEWDNPMRSIFDSCRTSRRLAMAYRSLKIGSSACFAAAGCLAAITVSESLSGLILTATSILATLSAWPTPIRVVNWSKEIIRAADCAE